MMLAINVLAASPASRRGLQSMRPAGRVADFGSLRHLRTVRVGHFILGLTMLLTGGCATQREAADYSLLKSDNESVRCDAFYRFFGTPESITHRTEVRSMLAKSRRETEELFGEPSWIETSGDREWRRSVYFFEVCPASASTQEKKKWMLGYYYIITLEFRSQILSSCSVSWPRVYNLKTGVVR